MRRTTLFRLLTVLYLAAIAVLCFAKFSSLPSVPGSFLGIPTDKIVHFLMFLPFPVLALLSFKLKKPAILKIILIIVMLFFVGCMIAWGTEYMQGLLPYRDMDPVDFKADSLGLFVGSILSFIIFVFAVKKANA
ncbi:MAG: VanZ family protein [Bacteroidales bacterium]|nr:VanZ family protein [Bacteroidales bacterium]